jgi:NAD+ kinase
MISRIQLLDNPDHAVQKVRQTIEATLNNHGFAIVDEAPDLIITIGGDGTYVYHMQRLGFPSVPTVGVNAGSLGYFQELEIEQLDAFAGDVKNQKYQITRRALLDITDESGVVHGTALNEIYIVRDSPRSLKARLQIGKGDFARFVGDGLIFSTTQGSTAYAAAAGGPILTEELPVYEIVPSNAHDTTMYESLRAPLVLPENVVSHIEIIEHDKRPVRVEADGIVVDSLDTTKVMNVRFSQRHLEVLRTDSFDYFERLAYKMLHRRRET